MAHFAAEHLCIGQVAMRKAPALSGQLGTSVAKCGLSAWMAIGIAGAILVSCSSQQDAAMRDGAIARQQFQSGQIEAARQTIAKAVGERGDVADLQLLRGDIESAAGSDQATGGYETAFNAYRQAAALDVGNVQALQGVAQTGLLTGHTDSARQATDQLLALDPHNLVGLMTRGFLQLAQRQFDDALSTATELLEVDPNFEEGALLKARILLIKGERQAALDTVDKASAVHGLTMGIQLAKLEIARDEGDTAAMMAEFALLRKSRPDDIDLRLDEANLRYKIGDQAGARALTLEIMSGKTLDDEWSRKFVALLYEYERLPFTAAELHRVALNGRRSVIEAFSNFLLDSGRAGQVDILLSELPRDRFAGLRARAAAEQGRDAVALEQAQGVLAVDKTDCEAQLALAAVRLHQRDPNGAVVAAQSAQSECPFIVGGWAMLAGAYDAKHDPAGARRVLEQGVIANPQQSFLPGVYANWLLAHGEGPIAELQALHLTQTTPALMSGWSLYRRIATAIGDKAGVSDADQGAAKAKQMLGIDLVPGLPPPRGMLYSRLEHM